MKSNNYFNPQYCYLFALLVVLADQLTKLIVEQTFRLGESIPIVETMDFLRLTFITNTGAAWGILRGYHTLLVLVAILVSVGCVWIIESAKRPLVRLSASCILGGGIGNMLDRLFLSYGVVDFVDVGVYGVRWPAFNVADSLLFVGMIVFVVTTFRTELSDSETGEPVERSSNA